MAVFPASVTCHQGPGTTLDAAAGGTEIGFMSLPLKPLPIVENWDCHTCGICCFHTLVPLSADDLARFRQQGWERHPEFAGQKLLVPLDHSGERFRLAKRADGGCVFLTSDGLCRIHRDFGFAAKPAVCQLYPLQTVALDDTAFLTVRRGCPSAAADLGRPAAEHMPEVLAAIKQGRLAVEAAPPPRITPAEKPSWPRARRVLQVLARVMNDQRFPAIRRLVHGLTLCRLLEKAHTRKLDERKLAELLEVLAGSLPAEAAYWFGESFSPRRAALSLFRQAGLDVARVHPRYAAQNTWGERWRMLRAGWSLARGRGNTPALCGELPAVPVGELDRPLGKLASEVYVPLTRFLETQAHSYFYAVPNRQAWSVVESFRSLALTYPLGLWLLRWLSHGRTPTPQDALAAVNLLDRAQGYDLIYGFRHRHRLRLLQGLDALEPLVIVYGR